MPKSVEYILYMLNKGNNSAYIVGGCVRDSLMGVIPHDWDICTSCKPDEVKKIFKGYRIIETGIKHGTITVVIEDEQYEITTYRIDGVYEDNRHPTEVTFTDKIEEDLSRRDFTINAIAYNNEVGIVDPFGGVQDIDRELIRCVGNPNDRFTEDALRILRAERFSMTLGFDIDEETEKAMLENRLLLKNIAVERINSELWKAISKKRFINVRLFILLQAILPEYFSTSIIRELEFTLSRIRTSGYITIAFIHQIIYEHENHSIMKNPQSMMEKLRFSNHDIKYIRSMLYGLNDVMAQINNDIIGVNSVEPLPELKRLLNRNGEESIEDTIALIKIYVRHLAIKSGFISDYVLEMERMLDIAKGECHTLSQLKVDGNDLLQFGFKGEEIGLILQDTLNQVIYGVLRNEKNALINYISKTYLYS